MIIIKEPENKTSSSIDWKAKLTSRKFWVSVIGFITPLLIAFGLSDNRVAEIAAIIMSRAQLIAYVIGEGLIDASRILSDKANITQDENSNDDKSKE